MHPLDDAGFVHKLDPNGMYKLTLDFPDQCARALEIARSASLPDWKATPNLVVLTGLGGSAAGGDFVRALFEEAGKAPFMVNRDYTLPAFVSNESLVFAVSYSGNTEETLSAYHDARRRGCPIIAVTSGGKLAELARADGFPVIIVPGGQPPRTALGYMLVPVIVACERLGLIPAQPLERAIDALRECLMAWGVETPHERNSPKQVAQAMHGKVGVIYGMGGWQGLVANRWKGQINENSKNLVFPNSFPELCHNEILGWVRADSQNAKEWIAVYLEDGSESAKMKVRGQVIADGVKGEVIRVRAQGDSLLEKMLTLTFFGDFVSLYLAALVGVDPMAMEEIEDLKKQLANVA